MKNVIVTKNFQSDQSGFPCLPCHMFGPEMLSALRQRSSLCYPFLLIRRAPLWTVSPPFCFLLTSISLLPNSFPQPIQSEKKERIRREKKWRGREISEESVEKKEKNNMQQKLERRTQKQNLILVSIWKKWVLLYSLDKYISELNKPT